MTRRYTAAEQRERMADNELLELYVKMADRMSEQQQVQAKNIVQWTRFDDDQQCQRNGAAWKNAAGRAKGQVDVAERILKDVERLLAERGYGREEITAHYRAVTDRREREALAAEAGNASFDVTDSGDVVVDAVPEAPVIPAPAATERRSKVAPECRGHAHLLHRACPECGTDTCLFWTEKSGAEALCARGHRLFPNHPTASQMVRV